MATDADHLLWIDLETTGLTPAEDEILEIGMILTDDQLNPIAELELLVQPSTYGMARLAANPYVQKMHTDNGLLNALSNAALSTASPLPEVTVAGRQILDWMIGLGATKGRVAICGSGVAKFDYQFLERLTPELTDFCAYFVPFDSGILRRSYRTSTGTTLTTVDELKTHRGIDDIRCHLAEAQQFRNLYRMAALILEQNPDIDLSDPDFDPATTLAAAGRGNQALQNSGALWVSVRGVVEPAQLTAAKLRRRQAQYREGTVTPISEDDARRLLADDGSPAADPARYDAIRCERGWMFYFRRDSGPVLMGTGAWIVGDGGWARMRRLEESDDAAVGREIADGGRTGPGAPSQ